jgi:hypothetical protein
MALGHGQNTCISLLLLTAVVWSWRKNQALAAGLICGLMFYKPQLAAVIAGILVISSGWRAFLGLTITGAVLLAASQLTMPGATQSWLAKLPGIVRYMQIEHRYMWERHATLKAFWRLLLQGYEIGPIARPAAWCLLISVMALSFAMTLVVVRERLKLIPRDVLIAATIISMPLLMPFYFDYDLLLLAVPAVLMARASMQRAVWDRLDSATLASWVALFAWMFVNPFLAGRTHINGTVIVLAALATTAILQAQRRGVPQIMARPARDTERLLAA